jgi:hypothetical protein
MHALRLDIRWPVDRASVELLVSPRLVANLLETRWTTLAMSVANGGSARSSWRFASSWLPDDSFGAWSLRCASPGPGRLARTATIVVPGVCREDGFDRLDGSRPLFELVSSNGFEQRRLAFRDDVVIAERTCGDRAGDVAIAGEDAVA